jgi:Uma2 family endonuclease
MPARPDVTIPRRATYEDYRLFPDDGKRYEILDGEIFMTPAPSPRHQYASKRLQRLLEDYFEGARGCLVFNAPLDVILSADDVVQPDLVVANRPQVSARGVEGPPLVLVEVQSPSRPDYDRLTKARRYAARGVSNYWIVDPDARTLECFRLQADAYRLEASAGDRDVRAVPGFDGLMVPLESLWLDS